MAKVIEYSGRFYVKFVFPGVQGLTAAFDTVEAATTEADFIRRYGPDRWMGAFG